MEDVPKKLNGLFKRGNKWSWRKRVPLELVDAYGRAEVVVSTGTSDLKEATKKANLEAVKLDGEFDHLRRELKRRNATGIKKRLFADLSESERVGIVLEWMKKCDNEFKENVSTVAPENVDDVAETFMEEQAGYADEHKRQAYQHSLRAAEQILDERNIGQPPFRSPGSLGTVCDWLAGATGAPAQGRRSQPVGALASGAGGL